MALSDCKVETARAGSDGADVIASVGVRGQLSGDAHRDRACWRITGRPACATKSYGARRLASASTDIDSQSPLTGQADNITNSHCRK